jgi:hypothetical protein
VPLQLSLQGRVEHDAPFIAADDTTESAPSRLSRIGRETNDRQRRSPSKPYPSGRLGDSSWTRGRASSLEANLGAIRSESLWINSDGDGIGGLSHRAGWTLMDTHGRRLAIYGSGGWVFESPRAR